MTLKVLSRSSQVRRAFPFRVLIVVIAYVILAILFILLTNNLSPTFLFILLLIGIMFVPADLFAADSIVGHSEKHILLKPKHGENKSKEKWLKEAVTHVQSDRYQEALVTFDQAIQLDRNYTDSYVGKVTALEGLGKPTEAAQVFQKARELGYEVES